MNALEVSAALWRVTWQAIPWTVGAWALVRLLPKLPASVRTSLWWLVGLKCLLVLAALGTVRLTIATLSAGWRAGQHVRVKVLAAGMGWWGWAESHPFTIASCADGGGEGEGVVAEEEAPQHHPRPPMPPRGLGRGVYGGRGRIYVGQGIGRGARY